MPRVVLSPRTSPPCPPLTRPADQVFDAADVDGNDHLSSEELAAVAGALLGSQLSHTELEKAIDGLARRTPRDWNVGEKKEISRDDFKSWFLGIPSFDDYIYELPAEVVTGHTDPNDSKRAWVALDMEKRRGGEQVAGAAPHQYAPVAAAADDDDASVSSAGSAGSKKKKRSPAVVKGFAKSTTRTRQAVVDKEEIEKDRLKLAPRPPKAKADPGRFEMLYEDGLVRNERLKIRESESIEKLRSEETFAPAVRTGSTPSRNRPTHDVLAEQGAKRREKLEAAQRKVQAEEDRKHGTTFEPKLIPAAPKSTRSGTPKSTRVDPAAYAAMKEEKRKRAQELREEMELAG